MAKILDEFMQMPRTSSVLIGASFLDDKMKRSYHRIVEERIARFRRKSE